MSTERIRVDSFQVVHFKDTFVNTENGDKLEKEIVILYALGEDGVIYEMLGGKWLPIPITPETLREMPQPPPEVLAKLNQRK
jgi:hypothetical protein